MKSTKGKLLPPPEASWPPLGAAAEDEDDVECMGLWLPFDAILVWLYCVYYERCRAPFVNTTRRLIRCFFHPRHCVIIVSHVHVSDEHLSQINTLTVACLLRDFGRTTPTRSGDSYFVSFSSLRFLHYGLRGLDIPRYSVLNHRLCSHFSKALGASFLFSIMMFSCSSNLLQLCPRCVQCALRWPAYSVDYN